MLLDDGTVCTCLTCMLKLQGRCNSDPDQRSVTVMITDQCPECEADHIDIQALTYNKVRTSCRVCSPADCTRKHTDKLTTN